MAIVHGVACKSVIRASVCGKGQPCGWILSVETGHVSHVKTGGTIPVLS
jgi:hypothetical protein